jgi:hypothetical protein
MAQTAVCNRHHSVDQQLCRWLLLSLDRLSSDQLTMTRELIANMLGVRREGVTEAAGKLQRLGVIRYSRGQITVLDRAKLEQLCCECYGVVKRETDRLLPSRSAFSPLRDVGPRLPRQLPAQGTEFPQLRRAAHTFQPRLLGDCQKTRRVRSEPQESPCR